MITHDEARDIIYRNSTIRGVKIEDTNRLRDYTKEQEKKEKLLELYRNLSMETAVSERSRYWERINEIERDIYG